MLPRVTAEPAEGVCRASRLETQAYVGSALPQTALRPPEQLQSKCRTPNFCECTDQPGSASKKSTPPQLRERAATNGKQVKDCGLRRRLRKDCKLRRRRGDQTAFLATRERRLDLKARTVPAPTPRQRSRKDPSPATLKGAAPTTSISAQTGAHREMLGPTHPIHSGRSGVAPAQPRDPSQTAPKGQA
jgi:hypothetical protein